MLILEEVTAVLLAKSYNLPIFSQLWLLDNGIITKEEFESGESYFTPVAVNVPTPDFELLIMAERLQVVIKVGAINEGQALLERLVGGIVENLPHTPYKALGLNFRYRIKSENEIGFSERCRNVFVNPGNPLQADFDDTNARFGLYLSKDIFDARLRLDIKPVKPDGNDALNLAFNIERQIARPEDIGVLLSSWSGINDYTKVLSEQLNNALEGE